MLQLSNHFGRASLDGGTNEPQQARKHSQLKISGVLSPHYLISLLFFRICQNRNVG
jgi:hypothetical protein